MTFRDHLRHSMAKYFEHPLAQSLYTLKIGPNAVTILGLITTAAAGHLISRGYFFSGGLVVLLASAMDMLDGALARLAGKASRFGAALDSVADRIAEAIVLVALLAFYAWDDNNIGVFLSVATLVASFMVSYIRARGEGLGIAMKESGLVTRTERVIIMVVGLLTGWALPALAIILGFSVLAAVQRMYHIWQETKD